MDLVLKCFGFVAIALALLGTVPAEQVALMLIILAAWMSRMNIWAGVPVYGPEDFLG